MEKFLLEQAISNAVVSSGQKVIPEADVLAAATAFYAFSRGIARLRKRFDSDILQAVVRTEAGLKDDFATLEASAFKERLGAFLRVKSAHVLPLEVEKRVGEAADDSAFIITSQRDGTRVKTTISEAFAKSVEFKDLVKNFSLAKALGDGPFKLVKGSLDQSFNSFDEFATFVE